MKRTAAKLLVAFAASFGLAGVGTMAVSVDLTTAGSSGSANGALFQQIDPQSTGSGVIDPFLRIQATGTEHGFNNSVDAFTLDNIAKGGQTYNHDLLLGSVPRVVLEGVTYYEFLLDVNQNRGNDNEYLSMHEMEIWLKSTPITTFAGNKGVYSDLTGSGAVKTWDLDSGADGDSVVELNYELNHGSGAGDMFAYIPQSILGTDLTKYVYLYSAFGVERPSNDGFEEWAVLQRPPPGVPDGGLTLILLGLGLATLEILRRRFV